MVPKELLGNEEEGKGIPFLGSQKKGNQKGSAQPRSQQPTLMMRKNHFVTSAHQIICHDNLGPLTPPHKSKQLEAMGYRMVPRASAERHGIIPKYGRDGETEFGQKD